MSPLTRYAPPLLLAFVGTLTLSGCDLAEGILKLGFWSGVIIVVIVVAVIAFAWRAVKR